MERHGHSEEPLSWCAVINWAVLAHKVREELKFIVGIYLNRYLDTRVSLNRLD